MGRHSPQIMLGVGAVILAASLLWWLRCTKVTPRHAPQTIQQAVTIAAELGLCWGTDERDGVPVHCLVISECPVARARAGGLRVNNPRHPCWLGTVRLYTPWQPMLPNYDPTYCAIWGEFFICGDPHLIRKLTGQRLCDRGGVAPATFR